MRWVDWTLRTCRHYHFLQVTCHMAVAFLDRLLARNLDMTQSGLKLAAGACLLIASKVHEVRCLMVMDVADRLACATTSVADAEVWAMRELTLAPPLCMRQLLAYELIRFEPMPPVAVMDRAWRLATVSLFAFQLPSFHTMPVLLRMCLETHPDDVVAFDELQAKIDELVRRRKRPAIELECTEDLEMT